MGCSDQKIFVCFCPCVVLVLVWSFSFLTGLCHAFWGFLENSFWLGVYPGLTKDMLDFVVEQTHEFIKLKI